MSAKKRTAANSLLEDNENNSSSRRAAAAPLSRRSRRRISSAANSPLGEAGSNASTNASPTSHPQQLTVVGATKHGLAKGKGGRGVDQGRGASAAFRRHPERAMIPRRRTLRRAGMDTDVGSDTESASTTTDTLRDRAAAYTPEGVGVAIKGLERMERRLQRAVKRQKLKVEESVAVIEADTPAQIAFKPRPTRNVRRKSNDFAVNPAADPTPGVGATEEPMEARVDDDAEATSSKKLNKDISDAPQSTFERGAARSPPVNSANLPLPWKGRLGYACVNTYLRAARPPVFSSRTCRMSSIIDHRYPLHHPSEPEHPTRNRPDKTKPSDKALGQRFVQELGLANARDAIKMIRWNDRYGIRFFRLSSDMFPFASHKEHGYKLAPFASEVLAEVGRTAARMGHRLTTHPGQFTQLGSPKPEVIAGSVRDLEYHDELLTLLRLPPQQDRDAVIVLHLGGVYGDRAAAIERFKRNYTTLLSDSIKRRLVLENDDVSWSLHDLLPLCEGMNIPLVLDYHHHNIVFDATKVREGTLDLEPLIPRIKQTWTRKGITMKMHYSEPCPGAVTPRDRRKHSPRVATLPPCPPDVDLMIEAKDKEQAVFDLMRNFRLPGFERIADMIPYERPDQLPPVGKKAAKAAVVIPPVPPPAAGKVGSKKNAAVVQSEEEEEEEVVVEEDMIREREETPTRKVDGDRAAPTETMIPDDEMGMGGPEGRVYWPPGMEEWLWPRKQDQKRKIVGHEEVIEDGD